MYVVRWVFPPECCPFVSVFPLLRGAGAGAGLEQLEAEKEIFVFEKMHFKRARIKNQDSCTNRQMS